MGAHGQWDNDDITFLTTVGENIKGTLKTLSPFYISPIIIQQVG
jgi:hypothetical protein